MINNKTKGFLLGAIAAASYGMNPLFTLPLYSAGMSVDSVLFYRYALAIVVLGIMMKMQKQSFAIKKADVLPLCIMGLLFSFSSLFLFMSYNYMDAGIASTILFVYPVLVAIIMAVVFKEKVSPVTMFSIALAFVGISLLCKSPGGQTLSLVGITFVFLSSLSYAIYIVGVNRSSLKDMPIAKLTFYVLLFGLSVYVVRLKFCTGLQPIPTPLLWVNAVSLAVFSYCYFVGDHDKGHTLHWFHPHCYSGCFGACYSFILRSTDFWRAADTAHYSGHFDGDYCRNSDYRRKNIAEKKQDSVKAYWQIKSDFVSLPLQL